jgi:hypothetical protein
MYDGTHHIYQSWPSCVWMVYPCVNRKIQIENEWQAENLVDSFVKGLAIQEVEMTGSET